MRVLWTVVCLAAVAAQVTFPARADDGAIDINVTDVLGADLPCRIDLHDAQSRIIKVFDVPKGTLQAEAPSGHYKAFVYVYYLGLPVLIDIKEVAIEKGQTAFVLANLVEGTGELPLLGFDKDADLALDRVELAAGTDENDVKSIPGRLTIPFEETVFDKSEGWYRGELHAHSTYGIGKESVKDLVKRAEKAKLDFLAITDRNTMAACLDEGFKSKSVVLIPAMEWGDNERGVALIYGPATVPWNTTSNAEAQRIVAMVQAQGGFYAIAHPCFPTAPWQWGLSYVNGIEVWCRDWRSVPPMRLEQLNEDMQERVEGKLVHSIAFAAASPMVSANGQASIFYDCELTRGLKASVIAGSSTAHRNVPMAEPMTCVFALEKSLRGILDGMRRGRTYVTSGPDGPELRFSADVLQDNEMDVTMGGVIPFDVPTRFVAAVKNAKGAELQIMRNGRPIISKTIESQSFSMHFDQAPKAYAEYRMRVISAPDSAGFGVVSVLAMSSPIYAQNVDVPDPAVKMYKERKKKEAVPAPEIVPPPFTSGGGNEIVPKWRF